MAFDYKAMIREHDRTLDDIVDVNREKLVEAGANPAALAAYDGVTGLLVQIAISLQALEDKLDA